MALVRCTGHGPPAGRKHVYMLGVAPAGDGLGILCGTKGCQSAGVVYLNESEARDYAQGVRDFNLFHGYDVQFRLSETVVWSRPVAQP